MTSRTAKTTPATKVWNGVTFYRTFLNGEYRWVTVPDRDDA